MGVRPGTTIGRQLFSLTGVVTSFLAAARTEQEKIHSDNRRLRLFSGTSNPALAQEISAYLGVPDGPRVCKRFADGELYVQIQESIRGMRCLPDSAHLCSGE